MKLPSLSYLGQSAGRAFLRFPFSIIAGIFGAGVAIYLAEAEDKVENYFPYINLMLTFALGIPLFFCADVFSYGRKLSGQKQFLLRGFVCLILLAIYLSLPGVDSTQNTSVPYIRYSIYNIAVHLLVAFIPFIGAAQLNGFWHYNKILFVRILAALLYSGALYAGLVLALGSLDFLFDIDVHDTLYLDLFILIGGVFNTWFFLAGIPDEFQGLDHIYEYPKGIKIFSQYVLLSLLILYLVILYAYAGKIVFTWSWPKGIVSYLISCVAVLGILTLLLIHPYGNLSGNTWIRKFSRIYYVILVPLIVLLFIAIGMRISDYGVTINRYIIVLLGVWLTIVSSYFILGKRNIKFIPVSLAVILIAVSFGFWGMFSLSERSQVRRLHAILERQAIIKDGKIVEEVRWLPDSLPKKLLAVNKEGTNESKLSDSLHNEVKSILDYLDDHHGFASIRTWFAQDLDSIVRENNLVKNRWMHINEAEAYMRSMGLPYNYRYSGPSSDQYFSYQCFDNGVMEIDGFDYLLELDHYFGLGDENIYRAGDRKYSFVYPTATASQAWLISENDSLKFEVGRLGEQLAARYGNDDNPEIQRDEMTIDAESKKMRARLYLDLLSMKGSLKNLKVDHLNGTILLREKK